MLVRDRSAGDMTHRNAEVEAAAESVACILDDVELPSLARGWGGTEYRWVQHGGVVGLRTGIARTDTSRGRPPAHLKQTMRVSLAVQECRRPDAPP